MMMKGKEVDNWNWQSYDRKQGLIPNENAGSYEENFELEQEISKIDEGLFQRKDSPQPFKERPI